MKVPIEQRLVQLLLERGFTPTLHARTDSLEANWTITFRDKEMGMHVITPVTKVDDLWWLE